MVKEFHPEFQRPDQVEYDQVFEKFLTATIQLYTIKGQSETLKKLDIPSLTLQGDTVMKLLSLRGLQELVI